jgi:hypothetical protein
MYKQHWWCARRKLRVFNSINSLFFCYELLVWKNPDLFKVLKPTVVVEWITFVLHIREVIISKLIQRQALRRSLWDSSAVQANSGIVRNIRPRPLPSFYSSKLKEGWMDPSRGLEILRRENLLPPPRIEHRFLGCPFRSLVTTANDPPPTTLICKCKNLTHALHEGALGECG